MKVVAYLPEYRMERFQAAHAKGITDLIFFALKAKPNGELDRSDFDPSYMTKLRAAKKQHKCRLLIAVGGWEQSQGFIRATATPKTRKYFIENVHRFLKQYGFDGVDYDWEHPANATEEDAYGLLFRETKQAFRAENLLVTTALAHWQNLKPEYFQFIDRIHLMAYDNEGQHSTFAQAKEGVQAMLKKGVTKDQLCLGLPFYGRLIKNHNVEMDYAEIMEKFHPAPNVDEAGGFYFNNVETIRKKVQYAQEAGLGGVMIWDLGQDRFEKPSLLETIRQTIERARG
jgi:GH18 family chitinase